MKKNTRYVALDIEASSLDPEEGEIIEIGAAKFNEKGKEIDKFSTLIKNKKEVPKLALIITGIKEKDLQKAPFLEEVKEKFQEFIKGAIIVGHNVNFDIKYLKKNGLRIENPVIDTWHLATILLGGLSSYSLESLTSKLKIEHLEKHRALNDGRAAFSLFLLLKEKIKEIALSTRKEIKKYFEENKNALALLFAEKELKIKTKKKAPKKSLPVKIDFREIERILEHEKFPEIKTELNKEEVRLLKEIFNALHKNSNLVVEVPSNIKKNLVYLLAASAVAAKSNKKIILALPPSSFLYIVNKIIPCLKSIFPVPPKISFFDCRENYFCPYRFNEFKKRFRNLLPHKNEEVNNKTKELVLFVKIILWKEESRDKKLSEIPAFFEERRFLQKMSASLPLCLQKKCEYFKNKDCPYYKALCEAKKANIVIVPTSFLFAKNQNGLLSKNSPIIINRAEALEETIFRAGALQVSYIETIDTLNDIKKAVNPLQKKIENLKSQLEIFFGLVGIFLQKTATDQFPTLIELLIEEWYREGMEFKKIKDALPNLLSSLSELEKNLFLLKKKGRPLKNHDLEAYSLILKNISIKLKNIVLEPKNDEIYWASFRGREITLFAVPKKLAQLNELAKTTSSLVLVSEIISLKSSFNYFKENLFLDEKFKETIITPKKEGLEKISIFIIKDFFASPHLFAQEVSNMILKTAPLAKRFLVALPSISVIQNIFEKISDKEECRGVEVIGQRIGGGKLKILQRFKKSRRAILLATYDFLERSKISKNIDGVIVARLPFERGRVYFKEKMNEKNAFPRLILPKALLKMKSLFNLIIKSRVDKKFFLILDDRISSKSYGVEFLSILPAEKITWIKKEEIEKSLK